MEQLLNYLHLFSPLSDELREHLASILVRKEFTGKQFLLRAGHVSRCLYFIESGLIRSYYMHGDRDITAWFMKENDMAISVYSFFCQTPSTENIQALENTIVHYITYEALQQVYKNFVSFNTNMRKILQHDCRMSEKRTRSIQSIKAKERYAFLAAEQPELLQRVPAKYLASYLGLTEATFCNIKKVKTVI